MAQETKFGTMMQNSHEYTSLKLFCKVSLKCTRLNLNIHQEVITAKSFQHTINNWSGTVNLHISKKCFFGGNIQISEYKTTLRFQDLPLSFQFAN